MKTAQQIIDETLKAENHDERYLYGRFHRVHMDKQILECSDFSEHAGHCCDTCHTFYIVYEMNLIETPKGLAWICCGMHRQLFPPTPEEEAAFNAMLRACFGSIGCADHVGYCDPACVFCPMSCAQCHQPLEVCKCPLP
jgi:hypothetical protein